jgi:hypothetical protein
VESKFKKGDRVAVYLGGADDVDPVRKVGTVMSIDRDGDPLVRFSNGESWYCHSKQLRRLIKPERRRVFLRASEVDGLFKSEAEQIEVLGDSCGIPSIGASGYDPGTTDFIEFVEVRRKK